MAKREKREKFKAQRLAAGLSQRTLAEQVGVSINAVRAWEQGKSKPYPRQHEPLRTALGVNQAELHRLLDPSSPIELNGHDVPGWLNTYESLVLAAGRLAQVEKVAIPALLQTKAYAVIIERYGPISLTDQQVIERVDIRLARQSALFREADPLQLVVLMAETVLLDQVGGDDVMAEQIDHLLDVAERPNVEIRLLPADGRAACARGGFEMLTRPREHRPFMVVTADVGGIDYEERPHVMAPFIAMFAYLDAAALNLPATIRRLKTIRKNYR